MPSSKGFNSSVCLHTPSAPAIGWGRHSLHREGSGPGQGHTSGFLPNTRVSGVPGQVSVFLPGSPPLGLYRVMEDFLQKEAHRRGQLAPKGRPFIGLLPLSALPQSFGA